MKKIYFVNKGLSEFLKTTNGLNLVNLGVLILQKNNSKFNSAAECIYRIVQDGISNLVPYMTKRIVSTNSLEVFKKLIMFKYNLAKDLGLAEDLA
jgi:predicted HAD superfamily hydrolase